MKRKKWSEQEEQTLLSKYSELVSSGALSKLKTREKKFKPIADHVTAAHHGSDPSTFPFRWSWRDVSVKVQNMRHQYLGVKQKIRLSDHRFDWPDGVNHWHNFLRYKHVFGDLDLPRNDAASGGFDSDEGSDEEREPEGIGDCGAVARREERRREREERRERAEEEREERRERVAEEREERRERREGEREGRGFEAEERVWERMRREGERRRRWEREAAEERRRRMRAEERREEEEMEWRERMAELQVEYERRAMRAHAEACQGQMQALGAVARLACQLFGPAGDGLGVALPPQVVLQSLQHPGGGGELGESGKPDANSPSEFM